MTTWLGEIPLDEITEQARHARPARTALTLVAALLFGLGWVAARVFAVAWLAVTWSFTAVRVGWQAAHGPSRASRLAAMTAEIEDLRTRLARLGGP